MDTKIKASFWSDKTVEVLPPTQKLAILWLFTAHVTSCGWVGVSQRRFEFETGSDWQDLLDAIKALGAGIVSHEKGFWIRNYIRHQIGDGTALKSNNMRFPILRSMAGVPAEILAEIAAEYPHLDSPTPPLSKPSESTPPPQEGRRGEERSNGKEVQEENRKADEWPEKILAAYPRTDSPMECLALIHQALDTGEDAKTMWDQVRECAAHANRAPGGHANGKIPSAKTFFEGQRWRQPEVLKARVDELIFKLSHATTTPQRRSSGQLNQPGRYA